MTELDGEAEVIAELHDGNLLRSGPNPEPRADWEGKLVLPADELDFGRIHPDLRGFHKDTRAISADHEEHKECGGVAGVRLRAASRQEPQVYRASIEEVRVPVPSATKTTVSLTVFWWPIVGNTAHSHVIMQHNVNKTEKLDIRKRLQLCFVPVAG